MTEQALRPQRRGKRVAMSQDEIDAFLGEEITCRIGTVNDRGPHVTALWYLWHGGALWLYSITGSQRWRDIERDPRVAVLVDAGIEYLQLRGVEITGTAQPVGEQPRVGERYPELAEVERLFAEKYMGGGDMVYDERHAWLRVDPGKITSWDFRKLPTT